MALLIQHVAFINFKGFATIDELLAAEGSILCYHLSIKIPEEREGEGVSKNSWVHMKDINVLAPICSSNTQNLSQKLTTCFIQSHSFLEAVLCLSSSHVMLCLTVCTVLIMSLCALQQKAVCSWHVDYEMTVVHCNILCYC